MLYLFSVVIEANEIPGWTVLAGDDVDVAGLGGGGLRGANSYLFIS